MTGWFYPTLADIGLVARKIGAVPRDLGLAESAAARPRTNLLGQDAYLDGWQKAAALLHSLVCNHAFIDGNRRVGWVVTVSFLRQNDVIDDAGIRAVPREQSFDLVMSIAAETLRDVTDIAAGLEKLFAQS